ncbi:patatin-like protein [Streptomyces sp. NPDC047043]|uniref:patatin-like protein n=1 Tax=Streptomyces sp. NPDC047043 TaxID=3154497 RepID=UPI0033D92E27
MAASSGRYRQLQARSLRRMQDCRVEDGLSGNSSQAVQHGSWRGSDDMAVEHADDMAVERVSENTQEIRIATAMTGGVSLAIWMGGVARELNLLQQAAWRRHPQADGTYKDLLSAPRGPDDQVRTLYLRLLEFLDVTVSIDMLSGTSAGGINGALLGLARAQSLDLGRLRDFWLKYGDFETLLRDPKETRPPSLLQGDGVLFKQMLGLLQGEGGLQKSDECFRAPHDREGAEVNTRLFITTTLLTGETSRFTDSVGTVVQDMDRRGLLVFDHSQLRTAGAEERVALAARCSSSYPFAFEPAFLPYKKEVPESGAKTLFHPAMGEFANITRDHWVADGGLLANRPIGPLLQAVFDCPAEGPVRRVFLYVVPSPGESPDPREAPAEKESFEAPWTLGQALLKDLGSVLGQSIRSDLAALQQHNDRVDSIRNTRLRMAEIASGAGCAERVVRSFSGRLLTEGMLNDYRARQSAWLVQPVIDALMRAVTTMPRKAIPQAWIDVLAPGLSTEQECRTTAAAAVSRGWEFPRAGDIDKLTAFGRPTYDGAKATVLSMLRAAYVCRPGHVRALAELTSRTHGSFVAVPRPRTDRLVADELASLAGTPKKDWPDLPDLAGTLATKYADSLSSPAPGSGTSLEAGWTELANVVADLHRLVGIPVPTPSAGKPTPGRTTAAERRRAAAQELGCYLRFLWGIRDDIPISLFDLHVATRSVLPVGVEVEQSVELIQVSADTRTTLAPGRATAGAKLTGMQLNHFGAFYKASWRANDWTWGRLDGAGWLVHTLLDPRRILENAELHAPEGQKRSVWFCNELARRVLDGETWEDAAPVHRPGEPRIEPTREKVEEELAYLDDPTQPVPTSLPCTSLWVARRWQEWICAEELPVIARHMLATPTRSPSPWALRVLKDAGQPDLAVAAAQAASSAVMSRNWSRQQRKLIRTSRRSADAAASTTGVPQDAMAKHLADCPVPTETLLGELGQPLFTRTVTKALATAVAAVTALKEPPASIKPFSSFARTVTMIGYRTVGLTKASPWVLTVLGLVGITLGFFLARGDDSFLGLTAAVSLATGCLLFGLAAWGMSRRLLPATVALLLVAAIVVSATVKRAFLFGKPTEQSSGGATPPPDVGWVGEHALPWLQQPYWHPLLALAGLIVLSLLISGAVTKLAKIIRRGTTNVLRRLRALGEGPEPARSGAVTAAPSASPDRSTR